MALRFPTEDIVTNSDFLINLIDDVLNRARGVFEIGLVLRTHFLVLRKEIYFAVNVNTFTKEH